MTIAVIEERLNRRRRILVHRYRHNANTPMREFIRKYLRGEYGTTATVYPQGGPHCDNNRRRSFQDMYSLCRNYYPEVTLKQFMNTLMDMYEDYELTVGYCGTINHMTLQGGIPRGGGSVYGNLLPTKRLLRGGFGANAPTYKWGDKTWMDLREQSKKTTKQK